MRKLFYIAIFHFFLNLCNGYSQVNEDASYLRQAQDLFNQGLYNEAKLALSGIMLTCYDNPTLTVRAKKASRLLIYSKSEVEGALILWARIHFEKGERGIAEESIHRLLEFNPNFKPPVGLYSEVFYNTLNNFIVNPKFIAGVGIGINKPNFKIEKVNSIYDSLDYSAKYIGKAAYIYSGFLEWLPFKNIGINGHIAYTKMEINRNLQGKAVDKMYINFKEIVYTNEMGLSFKKYFFYNRFKPYAGIGFLYSKMRQSSGNISLNYTTTDRYTNIQKERTIERNSIELNALRNKNRYGLFCPIGASYRIKNLLLSVEGRYLIDLNHYTNPLNVLNSRELKYVYYYIDNEIMLRRIDLNISIAYILGYKIKKK